MSAIHRHRRTGYDVSDRIDVTHFRPVCEGVEAILSGIYPGKSTTRIERAFRDCDKLYSGEYPDYRACETPYHNLQHVLDMTLATVRLMDGHEKQAEEKQRFGFDYAQLGILVSLFHDSGYIRKRDDTGSKHGAEYAGIRVERSADFLDLYLKQNKLEAWVSQAKQLVMYTGYNVAIDTLTFEDPRLIRLGQIIGTADLIAQMSDRVYLEKCRDFLFEELQIAGDVEEVENIPPKATTPDEFLRSIPMHIQKTMVDRLQNNFQNAYKLASVHFGGPNLYLDAMGKNFNHLNRLIESNIIHSLNRKKEGENDLWR